MSKIKDIPLIRKLCRAYMDAQRRKIHERYLRSPDSWYLKTLKGIHSGERCFVIGNGPSLRASDLDKLKDSYTFAANRIYEIFDQTEWRPTNYLIVDMDFLHEVYDNLRNYNLGHMFIRIDKCETSDEKKSLDYPIEKMTRIILDDNDTYYKVYQNRWNQTASYISEDISDHFSNGWTVTFAAIQLAIYMGFTDIYLLGVDFNYSVLYDKDGMPHNVEDGQDYFTGKKYANVVFNYNSMLHAYKIAREYCDNHNIHIKNATRGGKLEVFERVDFDSLFPMREK